MKKDVTLFDYLKMRNKIGNHLTGYGLKKSLSDEEMYIFGYQNKKQLKNNRCISEDEIYLAFSAVKDKEIKGRIGQFLYSLTKEYRPDSKYLYLMETIGNQYKIGISKNPNQRILSVATGCPTPVNLTCVWEVADARNVERHFHCLFEKFGSSGEWFKFPRAIDLSRFELNFPCEFKREKVVQGVWVHKVVKKEEVNE